MEDFGSRAIFVAGSLMTLTAPFVYYQRYFIHEGLFVGLTLGLLHCLGKLLAGDRFPSLVMTTGVLTALLFATKETASLVILAMGASVLVMWFYDPVQTRMWNRQSPGAIGMADDADVSAPCALNIP